MSVYLNPVWPWPLVLLAIAGLLAFSHWTYRRGTPARRLLLTLRWLTIALVGFVLLRPSLVFQTTSEEMSTLLILADKSESMKLRDMVNSQSRWDMMQRMTQESGEAFTALLEKVNIRQFQFDGRLVESILAGEKPDGTQTTIGDAIVEALQRSAGERIAGVIVMTDGANTGGLSPTTVARQLKAQKIPVYAFGFGQETVGENMNNIAATKILASPTVFAKNKMTVRGEFQGSGFVGKPVPVKLLLDGQEVDNSFITYQRNNETVLVDLTAIPKSTDAGDVKVTMQVDPQDGELLTTDNTISTYVTVRSGGIGVLAIEGKYRFWEPKFLRWALDRSPDIELSQLFLLDEAGRDAGAKGELDRLLSSGDYDVYVLGDVSANQFSDDQLRTLRKAVEEGAGLLMMGGYESFGPGGWGATPVSEALPVQINPADVQRKGAVKMEPTAAGLRHFILRLTSNEESNREIWAKLRPLDGSSTWSGEKPLAQLLATSSDGKPLLVAQDYGAGRVLAFAGDTTWRWRRGAEGIAAHRKFWRQLILWLAHKDDATGSFIRVKLDRRRLATGQKLSVDVSIEKADGTPLPSAVAQAVVSIPDGSEVPLELFKKGDAYQATFWKSDQPGDYEVKVRAVDGKEDLGETTVKFLVYDANAEMQQLAADHDLLRSMAEMTDGEFRNPEELPRFLKSLADRDLNQEVAQITQINLWDRWETLLLFFLFLSLEWWIRKRRGLA
ncbi:von Willebrand factor type A domain protein [Planctomycetes bacterium Pan216]|uniref:von Willebrand factor type A domain protein n=1 Tax=Kolteria novifilia TaxID=2527975 RepID=A0A518B5W0_9BACT|nr:von Willebrand factor type A domain protein [Planctomycetes bacterium Pan216]